MPRQPPHRAAAAARRDASRLPTPPPTPTPHRRRHPTMPPPTAAHPRPPPRSRRAARRRSARAPPAARGAARAQSPSCRRVLRPTAHQHPHRPAPPPRRSSVAAAAATVPCDTAAAPGAPPTACRARRAPRRPPRPAAAPHHAMRALRRRRPAAHSPATRAHKRPGAPPVLQRRMLQWAASRAIECQATTRRARLALPSRGCTEQWPNRRALSPPRWPKGRHTGGSGAPHHRPGSQPWRPARSAAPRARPCRCTQTMTRHPPEFPPHSAQSPPGQLAAHTLRRRAAPRPPAG
eukprot:scaffold15387_cov72-Phaeocystis_antarctica.AAC.1